MVEEAPEIGFFDPQHPLAHIGKKIILALTILAVVIAYYITRYSKGAEVLKTLLKAAPLMLVAMLVVETVYLILQGNFMKQIYLSVGLRRRASYLTWMYLGMNLVNTIAPLMGISGSIYMMHFEKKNNLDRSDTLLINFLYYLTDYLVFLLVLLFGLAYLLVIGEITRTIVITSLIFAVFVFLVFLLGLVLFSHQTALLKLIGWINKLGSKILMRKQNFISAPQVRQFVEGTQAAWRRSRSSSKHLFTASFYALFFHACCLGLLWLSFLTFHIPTNLQVIVAGYTVGTLLNIVSITPSGIGFAEGGMTAVFAALGIPVEQALVATLLYRLVFVWYPLILGLVALHLLPILARKQPVGRV